MQTRRTAVIARASQGIGAGLANGFLERDYNVVPTSRRVSQSAEINEEITMALFPGFSAESIETRGTTINVLRKGTGRGLLLLHGYPETHLT